MNKKQFSGRDICTKYITPALTRTGWDIQTQIRKEFALTQGRIVVRGKLHTCAQNKRAAYVLFPMLQIQRALALAHRDMWQFKPIPEASRTVDR